MFDECYNSDGEPEPFCDMKDPGDYQDFIEGAQPDFVPLDSGEIYSNDEGNEYFLEGGYKSNNNSSPPVHVEIT